MRVLHSCALFLALSAVPAFAQSMPAATPAGGDPSAASIDYVALKQGLENQNKALLSDVTTQRSIVKRNLELLKEAQKLDASNKKLVAEKQKLTEENANLEKQRATLAASQTDSAASPAK